MAKCLRCGATDEWLEGRVPDAPTAPPGSVLRAARSYLERLAAGRVSARDKPTAEVHGLLTSLVRELEDRVPRGSSGDT